MKRFILFFRGTISMKEAVSTDSWQSWLAGLECDEVLVAPVILASDGRIIAGKDKEVKEFHFTPSENASGFLIIKAKDLDEAVDLAKNCPILEQGGNITVRYIEEIN